MPGFNSPAIPQSASTCRIDGVDVSQLLRNIGEATANTAPLELFRLCLYAQRVLSATPTSTITKGEATLLAEYRAINDKARPRLVSLAGHIQTRFPRLRPGLIVVKPSQNYGEAV